MDACVSTGYYSSYFASAIKAIMAAQCAVVDPGQWPVDQTQTLLAYGGGQYDFVVVGAGSAGSVVANRLSEVSGWKILLVEAGGDPPIESKMPGLFYTLPQTNVDWKYQTVPQSGACLGMKNNTCLWPRGKVLGGSSALNAMMYVRGHPKNFDDWEKLGNTDWNFKSVLKYFKQSENFDDDRVKKKEHSWKTYHGEGGYLNVAPFNDTLPWGDRIIRAHKELGDKVVLDINNPDEHLGFTKIQGIVKDGIRASSAEAFIKPIKNRPNFHIVKHAIATKILFDDFNKKATGVILQLKDGDVVKINVNKEVVLSAGSINSPQLLMLSGIGPKAHLSEVGINTIIDLPGVGENLFDHIVTPVFFTLDRGKGVPLTGIDKAQDILEYFTKKLGNLATPNLANIGGFINTLNNGTTTPNIQFTHTFFHASDDENINLILEEKIGYNRELTDAIKKINFKTELLTMCPILLKPKSVGKLKLTSNNYLDKPLIYPNYFKDERDIETVIQGIHYAMRIVEAPVLAKYGIALAKLDYGPCNELVFRSKEYWNCYIRHIASSIYHPVGTAKMGPETDPMAVVTPRLKVRSIEGLRVVDASIMPDELSGNPNACIVMIGEKGSDMIKEDWIKEQNNTPNM